MHIKQKFKVASISLSVIAFAGITPAALASHGADDNTNTTSPTPTSSPSVEQHHESPRITPTGTPKMETENETETHNSATETESHDGSGSSLESRVKQLLDDKRQNKPAKSTADLQKICQQHQADINKKIANLSTKAQNHLTAFNNVFTKVQAFQSSHNLSVSNYDTLVADATAKQTAATTAVNALKSVSVTVDCSTADPASSIATVQTAASDARTALQAYRSSLLALVNALLDAGATPSPSISPTPTESN